MSSTQAPRMPMPIAIIVRASKDTGSALEFGAIGRAPTRRSTSKRIARRWYAGVVFRGATLLVVGLAMAAYNYNRGESGGGGRRRHPVWRAAASGGGAPLIV